MPYIVTVHRRTANPIREVASMPIPSASSTEFKCFEQEFADDQFNMSKFVLSLNKPVRKRGPKPQKGATS
jgi:hypothetical protein